MQVKLFTSIKVIDSLYNLNNYIQYKHVWKLFEVGYLHHHTVTVTRCAPWVGMKNCSKFLRNLVTTVHFTDRNWISKGVY